MDRHQWTLDDIKEINFTFHNDRWHLCLTIEYHDYFKILKDNRIKVCGIDLGETNPVVMYDDKPARIPKHLQYPKDKMEKLNRRCEGLQRVYERKTVGSNNYKKIMRKYHSVQEKMYNIRKDWHFKLAHWIVTHYKNIVVDEFKNHIVRIDSDCNAVLRKRCTYSMFNKSMCIFMHRLRHMCYKYGTNYFIVDKDSTNTCSKCGNKNKIPLVIGAGHKHRIFKCEKCNFIADRDDNVAKNCYQFFKNGLNIEYKDLECNY